MRQVILTGATLAHAILKEADLRETMFRNIKFRETTLSGANLAGANLSGIDFREVDLRGANLQDANLMRAVLARTSLQEANLRGALLEGLDLRNLSLSGASLQNQDLSGRDLSDVDLTNADLQGANLRHCSLVRTNLAHANISGCAVYGVASWDTDLTDTIQKDLIMSPPSYPTITVDNLEVAQFLYMLLNNEKVRDIIDTITSKVVLILGRFTSERFVVLEALRAKLREHNYLPILFDFDKPASRDLTETVSTLAHMSRFVIADITSAKSVPQELTRIVPNLPSVPVLPIIANDEAEWAMFNDLKRYPWVLPVHHYQSTSELEDSIVEAIIRPAESKVIELRP